MPLPWYVHSLSHRSRKIDVITTPTQMALERIPADIRADGGVSRMSDPKTVSYTHLTLPTTPYV